MDKKKEKKREIEYIAYTESPEETAEYAKQRSLYYQWKDTEFIANTFEGEKRLYLLREAKGYEDALNKRIEQWKKKRPDLYENGFAW